VEKYNAVREKSKSFAVRIIKLSQYLKEEKKETVLSTQLLKSGTSIGANVREGLVGMSRAEFRAKLNISLKEASETEYWLELLYEGKYLSKEQFDSIYKDCNELNRLLTSIVKNSKQTD